MTDVVVIVGLSMLFLKWAQTFVSRKTCTDAHLSSAVSRGLLYYFADLVFTSQRYSHAQSPVLKAKLFVLITTHYSTLRL